MFLIKTPENPAYLTQTWINLSIRVVLNWVSWQVWSVCWQFFFNAWFPLNDFITHFPPKKYSSALSLSMFCYISAFTILVRPAMCSGICSWMSYTVDILYSYSWPIGTIVTRSSIWHCIIKFADSGMCTSAGTRRQPGLGSLIGSQSRYESLYSSTTDKLWQVRPLCLAYLISWAKIYQV